MKKAILFLLFPVFSFAQNGAFFQAELQLPPGSEYSAGFGTNIGLMNRYESFNLTYSIGYAFNQSQELRGRDFEMISANLGIEIPVLEKSRILFQAGAALSEHRDVFEYPLKIGWIQGQRDVSGFTYGLGYTYYPTSEFGTITISLGILVI